MGQPARGDAERWIPRDSSRDPCAQPTPSRPFQQTSVAPLQTQTSSPPGSPGAKPPWLKIRPPGGRNYTALKAQLKARGLHTVCEEAHCPNVEECWGGGTATLMLLGDTCTRACSFCAVKTARLGSPLDPGEPARSAESVALMGLDYVVLTSVDRDDLADGGAAHFASCVRAIRERNPETLVEVLIPDFAGDENALALVLDSQPDVVAQNLETVERLTRPVRDPRAGYRQTLDLLARVKQLDAGRLTKSSLMLGLGEEPAEVRAAMEALRAADVDFLTLGQYLAPSRKHHPVLRYVSPAEFDAWRVEGEALGFRYVASGPLVRSSYRAGEFAIRAVFAERRASTDETTRRTR